MKKQFEALERDLVRLSSYNSTACMILNCYVVSKGTVIKYVANKLGARHYDTKRQVKQPKNLQETIYVLLDTSFDFYGDNPGPHNLLINFGEHGNALHAAILSMCQDFEESPDVNWFISTLNEFLQPPPNLGFK